jgi:hypothetical protein
MIVLILALSTGCENNEAPPASTPESEKAEAVQPESETSLYAEYLTVADVEEVTGMSGLTMKEEAITLKFYNGDGIDILESRFDGSDFYEAEVGANEEYYTPVSDLGEKAAICIPDMPYRVTFQQGDHAIMVQTIPQDGNLLVTEDQLIAIAKIISSRL